MEHELTAERVYQALVTARSDEERAKIRKRVTDPQTEVVGVRMKTVFATAKANVAMPLAEVDRMLSSNAYEMRMVAVSILDFKARAPNCTETDRAALYELVDATNRSDRHVGLH